MNHIKRFTKNIDKLYKWSLKFTQGYHVIWVTLFRKFVLRRALLKLTGKPLISLTHYQKVNQTYETSVLTFSIIWFHLQQIFIFEFALSSRFSQAISGERNEVPAHNFVYCSQENYLKLKCLTSWGISNSLAG